MLTSFLQLTSQDASNELTLSIVLLLFSSLLVILVHPLPVNTTVNSGQVNFTCEAMSKYLNFLVNNTPADDTIIANKGFRQQNIKPVNNTKIRRVLLVDPREDYNNTNISCIAITTSPLSKDNSDTVVLLIQGIYHVL